MKKGSLTSFSSSVLISLLSLFLCACGGGGGSVSPPPPPPPPTTTSVTVNVDVLTNRHYISPFVYGGAFAKDAATIADSGLSVVRWGGNAASTYNWKIGTYN